MKVIKKESCGIRQVFSTNVEHNHNYMSENGVINHNCLIDEGYRGEIGIHLINVGKEAQTIKPGDKIIQVVLLPVGYHMVEMVNEDEYSRMGETSRGAGAYGSTGNV